MGPRLWHQDVFGKLHARLENTLHLETRHFVLEMVLFQRYAREKHGLTYRNCVLEGHEKLLRPARPGSFALRGHKNIIVLANPFDNRLERFWGIFFKVGLRRNLSPWYDGISILGVGGVLGIRKGLGLFGAVVVGSVTATCGGGGGGSSSVPVQAQRQC